MKKGLLLVVLGLMVLSCSKKEEKIEITPKDYHNAMDQLTSVIVHDIFSPPVASRIYAYASVAGYEVIAQKDENYKSIEGMATNYKTTPKPSQKNLNFEMASIIAFLEVGKELIFSEAMMNEYRDSLYTDWEQRNSKVFNDSRSYGLEVANHVKAWLDEDNYKQTRTMPKFTVKSDEVSRWQPTPPMYMDGIEPHWSKIRPFAIDSAAQFKPLPHPEFTMAKNSKFYKELMEVYELGGGGPDKKKDEQHVEIASFWDCNPYVSMTKGHLMFATKKITPGGHWIGICKIASQKAEADFSKTVYVYAKASMAMADAFISCWDEKYSSNLIRPETIINNTFDESWIPVLQTPPFPEYTSGHSVVSGAASVILTEIFGDNFAFDDTTELVYGLPVRSFGSFYEASSEAAISRLYGGIHFRAAIDNGLIQGKNLGHFVDNKLQLAN
ncbi:vanadium-dependent haloperoxidase [Namhaeicola litoreus]|uniref:Vanadium-dependent haloperoxidase n=1 Tax=Namhaeicola litoreus TaxID=1052145 RepID=A0ABW3XYX1_9FLAO